MSPPSPTRTSRSCSSNSCTSRSSSSSRRNAVWFPVVIIMAAFLLVAQLAVHVEARAVDLQLQEKRFLEDGITNGDKEAPNLADAVDPIPTPSWEKTEWTDQAFDEATAEEPKLDQEEQSLKDNALMEEWLNFLAADQDSYEDLDPPMEDGEDVTESDDRDDRSTADRKQRGNMPVPKTWALANGEEQELEELQELERQRPTVSSVLPHFHEEFEGELDAFLQERDNDDDNDDDMDLELEELEEEMEDEWSMMASRTPYSEPSDPSKDSRIGTKKTLRAHMETHIQTATLSPASTVPRASISRGHGAMVLLLLAVLMGGMALYAASWLVHAVSVAEDKAKSPKLSIV